MLTTADTRSLRVLHLALEKCNSKLDSLAASTRHIDEARARMRVIESKHFHGARATSLVAPELRAMHIRREGIATLVEHIQCTLHDQVRIHYILTELFAKLVNIRALLSSMDRADRVPSDCVTERSEGVASNPPVPVQRSPSFGDSGRRTPLSRRGSRGGGFRNVMEPSNFGGDRTPVRGSTLRSQRSLPRRNEPRLIPFVVKRALSYNASPLSAQSQSTGGNTSWWANNESLVGRVPGRSEPRLNVNNANDRSVKARAETQTSSSSRNAAQRSGKTSRRHRYRTMEDTAGGDDDLLPVSPVSHCTMSDTSPSVETKRLLSGRGNSVDQSVLVDIDSLCTEASSVLSSSRGVGGDKPARRGSVSSSIFHANNSSKRSIGLSRFRFGRIRIPSQIKKMWLEINELYGVVLTHGPHLLEEKIVSQSSLESGILGPWSSPKKGRGGSSLRVSFQTNIVVEAIRKVDSIVLWQQRLIVAIRRDHNEQRQALRQSDCLISQAYLQSLRGTSGKQ